MTQLLPADDAPVANATLVYRWVSREQIVSDGNLGRSRPTTNAFKKTSGTDRMSVLIGDTLAAQRRDPRDLPDSVRTWGSLEAGFLRNDCEQVIERTPVRPNELAHGDIVGPDRKAVLKKMAIAAVCVEGDWADAAGG